VIWSSSCGSIRVTSRNGGDRTASPTGLPERLVFTTIAVDAAGNHLLEGLTAVTFAEHDGKTRLTLQTRAVAIVAGAAPMLEGMEAGWTQSIERLAAHVARLER
jgi:uncharacterized protein YndB with AHSA1/START domain